MAAIAILRCASAYVWFEGEGYANVSVRFYLPSYHAHVVMLS